MVFRQLDEEWVLFDPVANRLHVLNLAASLVWANCDGKKTDDEISVAVRDAFSSSDAPADIAADVGKTLSRFREEGLLA